MRSYAQLHPNLRGTTDPRPPTASPTVIGPTGSQGPQGAQGIPGTTPHIERAAASANGSGVYTWTFASPFSASPVVTACIQGITASFAQIASRSTTQSVIQAWALQSVTLPADPLALPGFVITPWAVFAGATLHLIAMEPG